LRRECSYTPSGSSSMTVRALEVLLPYAPPSAVALLK
jgi:hypothetical protein